MTDWCSSEDTLLVNWRLIDDNLLELIAKRLDIIDYIRFRAVCKTWRSISIIPERCPLPWLITGCDRVDGRLFYISFTDDKLHSIVVPALKENKSSTRVELGIVSCQGWLVLEGQDNSYAISLLNPLTRAHVHLPEAPKQLFTRRTRYNIPFDNHNYVEIQYLIHQMAMSDSNLSSTTDCFIVVISAVSKALVSLRMGVDDGSSWNLLNDQSKYEDVTFCFGCFLAVDGFGEVSTFSGTNLNQLRTIASPSMKLNYKTDWKLAYMSATRILVLYKKVSDCEGGYISVKDKKLPFYKTKWVNVYALFGVLTPPSIMFRKVKYLKSVLFYGLSSPPYAFEQLFSGMPNSVYIAGEHGEMEDDDDRLVYYVTMPQKFDRKNATVKQLLLQNASTNSMSLWHMPRP